MLKTAHQPIGLWIAFFTLVAIGFSVPRPGRASNDLPGEAKGRIVELFQAGVPLGIIDLRMELPPDTARNVLHDLRKSEEFGITGENQNFLVELAEEVPCASCTSRIWRKYIVVDKARGSQTVLNATNELAEIVYDLAVWDTKLISMGRRGDKEIYVVAVYDLNDLTLVDSFWAYRFSISPSKQFGAFVQYYGRHSGRQGEVVVLYDFDREPCENTLPGFCGSGTLVGIPVFPRENVENRSYADLTENRFHILSPTTWCENDTRLAFVYKDNFGNHLASLEFGEDRWNPEIRTSNIALDTWMRGDLPEERKTAIRSGAGLNKNYPLVVEEMGLVGNQRVSITPSQRANRWAAPQIELPIP